MWINKFTESIPVIIGQFWCIPAVIQPITVKCATPPPPPHRSTVILLNQRPESIVTAMTNCTTVVPFINTWWTYFNLFLCIINETFSRQKETVKDNIQSCTFQIWAVLVQKGCMDFQGWNQCPQTVGYYQRPEKNCITYHFSKHVLDISMNYHPATDNAVITIQYKLKHSTLTA